MAYIPKIVITGHKGFIGSKLFKKLKAKGTEDIMSNLPLADIVYHLAGRTDPAKSIKDPFWDLDNITLGLKIATKYRDKKIIYTSSICTLEPFQSPYGISKKAAENYIRYFCEKAVIIITPTIREDNIEEYVNYLVKAKDFKPGTYKFRNSIKTLWKRVCKKYLRKK